MPRLPLKTTGRLPAVLLAFIGWWSGLVFPVGAVAQETGADAVMTFRDGLAVLRAADDGRDQYYATANGVWRHTEHHEAGELDRLWGRSGQAVEDLVLADGRIVLITGGRLFAGPLADSAAWREVPAAAFSPAASGGWRRVRWLANRFVVAGPGGLFASADGAAWARVSTGDYVVQASGGDAGRLWCLAQNPRTQASHLGRSDDLKTWEWSAPLPAEFSAAGDGLALLMNTAVLAGSARTAAGQPAPALLAYRWPPAAESDRPEGRLLLPAGEQALDLAETAGTVWVRLPNGDVAASVNGFDWIRLAENPLGSAKARFVSAHARGAVAVLADGARYLSFFDEQVEYAGRGGAPAVAWNATRPSSVPTTPPGGAADGAKRFAGSLAARPDGSAGPVAAALPAQTKKVVFAGGKYLAITWAKNGLWAAEPGGPWRNVAAFGQQVTDLAVLGNRALAIVEYTGVLLWDAATGRALPVDPLPTKSFSTVHAVNGRFFGIGSAGHLAELGADGRWRLIALPSDDPDFGVQSLAYHDGHFLVSPVRQAGLYRTADFQNWTYAPMKGGNTRFGRLFNTGRRLLAVHHYGELEKDDSPVVLSVSTDGVAWQEVAGIVAARDSYFRGALHDGRRHVLVFTRELWVSEGDEAQAWRRVPVEQNSFFELTGDRLVAATPEGLMVRDAAALTFVESAPTRVARSLATNASWQAAGPAAVAERKKQEALAKAAADAIPPTVAGAVEMAKAFHHFERLYVSGAPRRDLAQQVVGVHEAVRKHRPQLADEVAEVLSVLVVNLEVRDARTTAFLAHHLPGFRKKVQARYGKVYSQIYWSLRRQPGAAPTQQEHEVDVMKELLMSHTDNSYLRRVTFPKVPQGYPNYDADKPRKPVEFAAVPDAPFDSAGMERNLVEKGWAGAALDRDVMHANKLQIEAATAMRHVWLLAARALWPGTPPASADDLLKRSKEEKARLGSLFATDGLALDARKAGRTDEFTRYRDLAVQRGMRASRYVSYAEQMADALRAVNEADRNMAAALGDYADQVSAATGGTDPVSRLVNQFPGAGKGGPAAARPAFELITAGEITIRDLELQAAKDRPEGPARKQALEEHHRKWDEKLRFRQLAQKLFQAAALPDTEANGMGRSAALLGISRTDAALFGKTPEHLDNRLLLPSLLNVAQNRIPRAQHAEVLDRVLRDVPTLADVWVLRAGCHIEAKEWALADGALAVARLLNPKEPSLEKMETRLDAQRPALTNADLIRQRLARTWEEAEASVDDELRSRDPAADYATGLEFEQGTKGGDVKERIDKAQFHYLKAALADHVPAMLGYVRVANASLQQPGVSDATRAAVEKGIVQWVDKAADLGNGEALRVRAQWRANGQAGLTADRGLAWLELERAAEAGDWPAMRMLAQAAHAGEWGRQDFKVVENWLERARAAGDPEAGRMLEELRKQHQRGGK